MARIDTRRGGAQPWSPGPPPVAGSSGEQIVRATWDELHRLDTYLNTPDVPPAPVAPPKLFGACAYGSDTLFYGASLTYATMFDTGAGMTVFTNEPASAPPYNPATGGFTVPNDGTYSIFAQIITNPVTSPTGAFWYTFLKLLVNAASYSNVQAGVDSAYMQNVLCFTMQLKKNDFIYFQAAGQHATRTGSMAVVTTFTVRREGD